MNQNIFLAVIVLLILAACTRDKDKASQPVMGPPILPTLPTEGAPVFLLMGQSNMSGLQNWTQSLPPNTEWYGRDPGNGPATYLADDLASNLGKVRMVQGAVPGTFLNRWVRGADLYQSTLASIPDKTAVKGVFFFQGESDAFNHPARTDNWAQVFMTQVVGGLRQDLNNPNLPVVFCQLHINTDGAKAPYWQHVQDEQASVNMPHVGMVVTDDLTPDGEHFFQDGYKTIAARMAARFYQVR